MGVARGTWGSRKNEILGGDVCVSPMGYNHLALLSGLFVCFLTSSPMGGCAHAVAHMWRSEDNSWESVPSFYHAGSGD